MNIFKISPEFKPKFEKKNLFESFVFQIGNRKDLEINEIFENNLKNFQFFLYNTNKKLCCTKLYAKGLQEASRG